MTDAATMKNAVHTVIQKRLGHLNAVPQNEGNKLFHPRYNILREVLLETEQELRKLIQGDETEVHEWLAVIHYALADERLRLLHS
jgi:hypothetical protein